MNHRKLVADTVALCVMACLFAAAAVTIVATHRPHHPQAHKNVALRTLRNSITPVEYTSYVHSQFANDEKINETTKAVLAEYIEYRNGQVSYPVFHRYTAQAAGQLQHLARLTAAEVPSGYDAYNGRVQSVAKAEVTGVALLEKARGIKMDAMADQLNVLTFQFLGIAHAFPKPTLEGHLA